MLRIARQTAFSVGLALSIGQGIGLFAALAISAKAQQEVLTNDSIISLAKAMSEEVIINMINTQPCNFELGTNQILALKAAGATDRVILAMLNRTTAKTAPISSAAASRNESPSPSSLPPRTEIPLELTEKITSESAHVNDVVHFKVIEDVRLTEGLVVPRGTPAEGEVIQASPKGRMGVPGMLAISLIRLKVPGGDIRLSGTLGSQFRINIGNSAMVPLTGGFKKGPSVSFPQGTHVKAFVAY